jgi:hypothetical protein
MERFRRFNAWSRRTMNRFALIWGVCLFGTLSSILLVGRMVWDGVHLSPSAVGMIVLLAIPASYLWGTVMWWYLFLAEKTMRALRNRRQQRRSG